MLGPLLSTFEIGEESGPVKNRFRDRRPFQDFMKEKKNYRETNSEKFRSERRGGDRGVSPRGRAGHRRSRSPVGRRSRSRSPVGRGSERRRGRSRSESPYSKAFAAHKRFKQSEKVRHNRVHAHFFFCVRQTPFSMGLGHNRDRSFYYLPGSPFL